MSRITLSNIEHFTHLFNGGNDQFNNITWIEPVCIAMTRAYQHDEEISIEIENSYFREMITNNYQENKTYSPVENIYTRTNVDGVANHITQIMLRNFSCLDSEDRQDLRDYLQYLFTELMNNVADHSHSNVGGYAMAQYYPNNRKVQFVIADRGVAFLENMLLNYADISNEEDAILKALTKGITSTKARMYGTHRNAGYGLYAMFEILKMTGGSFVIISNDTLLRYKDENFTTKVLDEPWKGVVVAFEFFESNINYNMDYFKRNYLWNDILDDEDQDFF